MLTKEERDKCILDITAYFLDERGEKLGVIAAGEMLDFFVQNIGSKIYNKAVDDTRTMLKEDLESLDYKLSDLRK